MMLQKKLYCVTWDASKAGKGDNEIASALLKRMTIVISKSELDHLIIWSNNCYSQNRNAMMLMKYLLLDFKYVSSSVNG